MYEKIIEFCEDNKLMINGSYYFNRYNDGLKSITEILSILDDETFNYIKENHKEALENACKRGTEVHENIETNNFDHTEYQKNRYINTDKVNIDKYYLRYTEWKVINSIKILHKEKTFTKGDIRGTIDVITNLGVVDYKSSLRENLKYHIQVAGYCWLSGEQNGYILHLSDKKYKFIKVDLEKYIPIFLELLELSKNVLAININNKDG